MDVTFEGPLFDPAQWDSVMEAQLPDATEQVAGEVLEMWRDTLEHNIRVNRQRYVNETRVDREDSASVLNDGTSVYGPWLEGTGSRNYPVTRFEGYGSARDATARAQDSVDLIAEGPIGRIVEELNT